MSSNVATVTVPILERGELALAPWLSQAYHNSTLKSEGFHLKAYDFRLDFAKRIDFDRELVRAFRKIFDIGPRNELGPYEHYFATFPDRDVFLSLLFPERFPLEQIVGQRLLAANIFPSDFEQSVDLLNEMCNDWAAGLKGADVVLFLLDRTSNFTPTCLLAQKFRNVSDATVLFAGFDVSIPEKARTALASGVCDYVLFGETEFTVPRVVRALEKGADPRDLAGLMTLSPEGEFLSSGEPDRLSSISTIPWPDFSDFPMSEYFRDALGMRHLSMRATRGCVARCSYCSLRQYWTPNGTVYDSLRVRTSEDVLSEMKEHVARYQVDQIDFGDDAINSSPKWLGRFLTDLKSESLDISWEACARFDMLDKPLLELAAKSGCNYLIYGLDSLDEQVLRGMRRVKDVDTYVRSVRDSVIATFESGIACQLNMVAGYPGESDESFWRQFRALESLRIEMDSLGYPLTFPSDPFYISYGSEDYDRVFSDPEVRVERWPALQKSTGLPCLDKVLDNVPHRAVFPDDGDRRKFSSFLKSDLLYKLSAPSGGFVSMNYRAQWWARSRAGIGTLRGFSYRLRRPAQPVSVDGLMTAGFEVGEKWLLPGSATEAAITAALEGGTLTFPQLVHAAKQAQEVGFGHGGMESVEAEVVKFLKQSLAFGLVEPLSEGVETEPALAQDAS
ncbi:MAG: radical SAM protein [Thermoplasmata archaeon]